MKKLAIFSGSLRSNAYTKQIGKVVEELAKELNLSATYFELNDFDLPLLNQDEANYPDFPEGIAPFREMLADHEGWVIITPEHNGSIPASLKNALDWASRAAGEDIPANALFRLRPTLILSASVGIFGGTKAANHLRQILMHMGALVFPTMRPFIGIDKLLDSSGQFINEKKREGLRSTLESFASRLLK